VTRRIRNYRDLDVWKRAVELAIVCHALAARLPAVERYGLADQLRRAAVSVPANIAEGNGRESRRSYRHFLSIAAGSLAEIDTHLELIERIGYVSASELVPARTLVDRVARMLTMLRRSLVPHPPIPDSRFPIPASKNANP
jgi:four helix bundle protein